MPFVDAVFRLIDGGSEFEGPIAHLVAAEERHAVRLLYSPGVSLALTLVPISGMLPPLRKVIALHHDNRDHWANLYGGRQRFLHV